MDTLCSDLPCGCQAHTNSVPQWIQYVMTSLARFRNTSLLGAHLYRRTYMGITNDGLSYWQAESEGLALFDITIGDLLDRRAEEVPDREALVYSCYPEFGEALDIRWTYQDYRERANTVAK